MVPREVVNEFEIRVKRPVDGLLTGRSMSLTFGGSPEFSEHRPYTHGDDLRRVDWKVFARKRKLFVKLFYNETEIPTVVLLDNTRSMLFNGKFQAGVTVAGAVMYMANRGNNRFSGKPFSNPSPRLSKGHIHLLSEYTSLRDSEMIKGVDLRRVVLSLITAIRKRVFVVLVSDFEFSTQELSFSVSLLTKRYEVGLVHVMSPLEWNFPYEGRVLVDMETGERLPVSPDQSDLHRRRIRSWASSVKNLAVQHGAGYSLVFSDMEPTDLIRKVAEDLFG